MSGTDTSRSRAGNPLGVASTVLSLLALVVCLVAITWVREAHQNRVKESERIANQRYTLDADRQTMEVYDSVATGVTFVGQVIVYGVGLCVGGTLALVGCVLGLVGLYRFPRHFALVGLAMSPTGPLALVLFLYLWSGGN